MISACGRPPALRRFVTASATARTCMAIRPGTARPRRTPRRPSIGFCSCMRSTARRRSRSCGSGLAAEARRTASSVRSGRNSWSGGSSSRIVTGSPSIAVRMPMKSSRCSGSRAASAFSRVVSSRARIIASTSALRSPRNMCSVRHRPMPWAPRARARAASSGVSALARTSRRRTESAWTSAPRTASVSGPVPLPVSSARPTSDAVSGSAPRWTVPAVPSTETVSPSCTTAPVFVVNRRATGSTVTASAPHTQTLPIPRATTAAWLVLPPRLVSTASAAIMPGRSSGVVSRRTRTVCSPAAARRTASAESKTATPTAAPGEAGTPWARGTSAGVVSKRGNISRVSAAPSTRTRASSALIVPSAPRSWAMRKAASAVRLPTRVCRIHSLPRSTVNSTSHRSR